MGNALSYVVLVIAVPVGLALFFALKPAKAAIVVFLGCVMFLPEKVVIDPPVLPPFGKIEAAAMVCVLGMVLVGRRQLREARLFRGPEVLVLMLLAGDLLTVLTNRDPLVYGPTELQALDLNEAVSLMFADTVWYLVPFFVGRALIRGAAELRMLLSGLALAGAVYAPLLFVELMMSPQLHNWIYGFHQHDFIQTLRGGGYRPMVFMTHGLAVGLLMCFASIASLVLARARRGVLGVPAPAFAIGNLGFLVTCKSLGAFLYAAALGPLATFASPRSIARLAALTGVLVLSYPACRTFEVFPTATLTELARAASPDRAASLQYRFDMEDLVSKHVGERRWFGWGRFGRGMVYDTSTGRPISVTDGAWIVVYGIHGLVGFVSIFLLLAWPLFALRRQLRRIDDPKDRILLAGLAVIVMTGTIDLLPNGLFNPLVLLFAGALYGAGRGMAASVVASPPAASAAEAR